MSIRKAVFPVAGLGSRFLPATKATPKEMLVVVDKPLIQYAVEEAIAAGVEQLIFVTSSSKRAIEDHFDTNYELESRLQTKPALLSLVQDILPKGVSAVYIRQSEPLGLGHAVYCAKDIVGDEPFAVLLADDLIQAPGAGCLSQMVNAFSRAPYPLLAVQSVSPEDISRYGAIGFHDVWMSRSVRIDALVEKPSIEEAPSQFGVVGRYILTPEIFQILSRAQPGVGGEIQLTDAIWQLARQVPIYAHAFEGKRYDCGDPLGFLQASIALALDNPTMGPGLSIWLRELTCDATSSV